ncbi:rhodanese/Cell cycle control phosphatasesuperfamily protein [Striga asiatica]|uniref:Rhodanese/Cell cycle control phosphatasesuperfamily protein n=1 Tax=Striga asiatica TaxID=4170 RepID=A0A5A7Q1H0_STRAF|nr:rhodanese/Cell cycle control phosphatasesuperfamily protein [Striga asiatica]
MGTLVKNVYYLLLLEKERLIRAFKWKDSIRVKMKVPASKEVLFRGFPSSRTFKKEGLNAKVEYWAELPTETRWILIDLYERKAKWARLLPFLYNYIGGRTCETGFSSFEATVDASQRFCDRQGLGLRQREKKEWKAMISQNDSKVVYRSLRPIVSDVQQLLMSHHSWSPLSISGVGNLLRLLPLMEAWPSDRIKGKRILIPAGGWADTIYTSSHSYRSGRQMPVLLNHPIFLTRRLKNSAFSVGICTPVV